MSIRVCTSRSAKHAPEAQLLLASVSIAFPKRLTAWWRSRAALCSIARECRTSTRPATANCMRRGTKGRKWLDPSQRSRDS
jgi:hypothetical protein